MYCNTAPQATRSAHGRCGNVVTKSGIGERIRKRLCPCSLFSLLLSARQQRILSLPSAPRLLIAIPANTYSANGILVRARSLWFGCIPCSGQGERGYNRLQVRTDALWLIANRRPIFITARFPGNAPKSGIFNHLPQATKSKCAETCQRSSKYLPSPLGKLFPSLCTNLPPSEPANCGCEAG